MPPTVQVAIEAGSGPIFRPYGARTRFACAPMTPGCTRTSRPPSSTDGTAPVPRAISTRMPSVTACPERLVPAARKISGILRARREREEGPHLVDARSEDDGLRHEAVEARVRGPRDPVDRARGDAQRTDDRFQRRNQAGVGLREHPGMLAPPAGRAFCIEPAHTSSRHRRSSRCREVPAVPSSSPYFSPSRPSCGADEQWRPTTRAIRTSRAAGP